MSPLQQKIYDAIKADTMSVPELALAFPQHDVSSLRRCIRQFYLDGLIEPSGKSGGQAVYWKMTKGIPVPKIRTYIRQKPIPMRQSEHIKRKFGKCGWQDVPKTDMGRGYGYVQSAVL